MIVTTTPRVLVTGDDPEARYPAPQDADFETSERPGDWLFAGDIERIALALIEHRERFAFLVGNQAPTLLFRWKRSGGEAGGRITLGTCKKTSGLLAYETGADFVIWLAADHCRDYGLTNWQVEALVFHELCHITRDLKTGKWGTIGHDAELFVAELHEYGAWTSELRAVARAARQLELFVEDGGL